MRDTGAVVELLENRCLLTAGPTASFLNYIKGAGTSRTFAVLYDGPADISRSSLDSTDVIVVGPSEFSSPATLIGVSRHKPGTGLIAQYRIDGMMGGGYSIEVLGQHVNDADGNFVAGGDLGKFLIGRKGHNMILTAPPSSIQVLGTTFGTSEFPPQIDTTFGTVVRAVNFGGDPLTVQGSTGIDVDFESMHANSVGGRKKHPRGSRGSVQVAFNSSPSDLFEQIVGDGALYETEIFAGDVSTETLTISNLDPAKRYQIQFLHGDGDAGETPYTSTTQTFTLPSGETATTALEFNTAEANEDSNTAIIVSNTTGVAYTMPSSQTHGPSFSGIVIEEADAASEIQASFVRSSLRLIGTGQTFRLVYPPSSGLTASRLAATNVTVDGPRGFSAIAALVDMATDASSGGVIATYRIEGIDVTGTYSISIDGQRLAGATFFYLRPMKWV